AAGPDDAGEVGLGDVHSPVFVTYAGDGALTSACGYRVWPGALAQMCVLTHPDHRGLGLAKAVASAATTHALDAGLVPQWRARPADSRAVAAALGYAYLGDQLSFRLDPR
ncbi:MAG TPA: GNAT family N-acetyltransferase, partial [Micromonosporaceae bacterium]